MLKWFNEKMKKRKGFTLVELVVVIAILGILAGIAVPKLSGSRNSAKVSAHNANVRILKSTATMYLADYPDAHDSTNDTEITAEENFKKYFDKEETPKTFDNKEFKVSITKEGDIKVEPGEVGIKDGEIKVVEEVKED
ncbi:type II secretion system protein [Tissierella sp. MB52-C2]|uniref:type II secretion system protein n=1 Tax=Tissierella sp. MB52-C2 TaxID=3070999 RepID=UPI00280B87D5|nr:type II secretion system protein [Tissierella sp. MB52-C2]WMM26944.1 type II secretion system protein [Tissierella sp. MB52-C2]